MTLEDLKTQWATDGQMDLSRLDRDLLNVPILHGKWWDYYLHERSRYVTLKYDFDREYAMRRDWYLGRLDEAVRREREWPPMGTRYLSSEVDKIYLPADEALLSIRRRLDLQEQKLKFIEDVLKQINQRSFLAKHMIDYLRFSAGST